MNFLEQLVAEWYAYRGFFARTNVKFGRRPKGGYEGEMDVVAFDPKNQVMLHVETSADSDSWSERTKRFRKKFRLAKKHYRNAFTWNYHKVEQIAVVGYSEKPRGMNLGRGIKVISIPELVDAIRTEVRDMTPTNADIPEGYALLRAIQFATTL